MPLNKINEEIVTLQKKKIRMMNAQELKDIQCAFHQKIDEIDALNTFDRRPLYDGVVDENLYVAAPIKIVWILKEGYCDRGGWDHSEMLRKQSGNDLHSLPTWRRVAYASYGLLNNVRYDDMPWIYDDESVANALKSVAWINISKTAGDSQSNDTELDIRYKIWRDVTLAQLKAFKPDVVVFGNTFNWLKEDIGLTKEPVFSNGDVNAYVKDGIIYLWAWHPAATSGGGHGVSDQLFADSLLDAYNEAKKLV